MLLKHFLLPALLMLAAPAAFGQRQNPDINNRNYYDYYRKPTLDGPLKGRRLSTGWLGEDEVNLVLQEELKKAGHEWVVGNQLYRLDSVQYVVLNAYSQKSGVGILYTPGHTAFPQPAHRQERGRDMAGVGHVDYVQSVAGPGAQRDVMRIRRLPDNVLMLAENWYWYQYTENPGDAKHLLTKDDALRILRQDVQEALAALPKR